MNIRNLNLFIKKHIRSIENANDSSFLEESVTAAIKNYIKKQHIPDLVISTKYSKNSHERFSGADLFLEYSEGHHQSFYNLQAKKITPDLETSTATVTLYKNKDWSQISSSIARIKSTNEQLFLKEITKAFFTAKYNQATLQFIECFFWQIENKVYNLHPLTIYYISPDYGEIVKPKNTFTNGDHIYVANSQDIYELTKNISQLKLKNKDRISQNFSDKLYSIEELFDNNREISFKRILNNQKGSFLPFQQSDFRNFIIEKIMMLIKDIDNNDHMTTFPIRDSLEKEPFEVVWHFRNLQYGIGNSGDQNNQSSLFFYFAPESKKKIITYLNYKLEEYKKIEAGNISTDGISDLTQVKKLYRKNFNTF